MSKTAKQLESTIRQNRLLDLPVKWADEIVYPAYDGLSIRNIPHSIANLMGTSLSRSAPLNDAVWGDDGPHGKIKRVIFFLSDGLGYKYLQQLCEDDPSIAELVSDLTDGRGPVPLTSIAPSTTAVALPTLWTGAPPAEHGMLGTLMFLREFSTVANMLAYKPALGSERGGVFENWGIAPEDFIPARGIAEQLNDTGIPTYSVLAKHLAGTGLSRILHRGVDKHYKHKLDSDFWMRLHDALTETRGKTCNISIYWSAVDALAHEYGAHNKYVKNEIKSQLMLLRDLIYRRDVRDGQTLFLLVADHGHADAENIVNLMDDEGTAAIRAAMRHGMGADNRIGYLHLQNGSIQQVLDAVAENYPDTVAAIPSAEALNAGLFGDAHYSETPSRLGDVILIARQGTRIIDPSIGILPLVSLHAGLSDWEMLVPLLWKVI